MGCIDHHAKIFINSCFRPSQTQVKEHFIDVPMVDLNLCDLIFYQLIILVHDTMNTSSIDRVLYFNITKILSVDTVARSLHSQIIWSYLFALLKCGTSISPDGFTLYITPMYLLLLSQYIYKSSFSMNINIVPLEEKPVSFESSVLALLAVCEQVEIAAA